MDRASSFELLFRAVSNGAREFVFEIAPWILVWLLIAAPFFWVLGRLEKEKVGQVGMITLAVVFTAVVAGICAGVHGVCAFGEAFGSAIDKDRMLVFIFLTASFPFIACWLALRKSKNADQA